MAKGLKLTYLGEDGGGTHRFRAAYSHWLERTFFYRPGAARDPYVGEFRDWYRTLPELEQLAAGSNHEPITTSYNGFPPRLRKTIEALVRKERARCARTAQCH